MEAAKGKKKKGKKRQELPGRPLEQDEPPWHSFDQLFFAQPRVESHSTSIVVDVCLEGCPVPNDVLPGLIPFWGDVRLITVPFRWRGSQTSQPGCLSSSLDRKSVV